MAAETALRLLGRDEAERAAWACVETAGPLPGPAGRPPATAAQRAAVGRRLGTDDALTYWQTAPPEGVRATLAPAEVALLEQLDRAMGGATTRVPPALVRVGWGLGVVAGEDDDVDWAVAFAAAGWVPGTDAAWLRRGGVDDARVWLWTRTASLDGLGACVVPRSAPWFVRRSWTRAWAARGDAARWADRVRAWWMASLRVGELPHSLRAVEHVSHIDILANLSISMALADVGRVVEQTCGASDVGTPEEVGAVFDALGGDADAVVGAATTMGVRAPRALPPAPVSTAMFVEMLRQMLPDAALGPAQLTALGSATPWTTILAGAGPATNDAIADLLATDTDWGDFDAPGEGGLPAVWWDLVALAGDRACPAAHGLAPYIGVDAKFGRYEDHLSYPAATEATDDADPHGIRSGVGEAFGSARAGDD